MRTWTATIAAFALLATGCADTPERDLGDEDAIEAPDRAPPMTTTPRADHPVHTADFEGMNDAHVTGVVRLYEMRIAGGQAVSPEEGRPAGPIGFRLEVLLDGLEPGEHDWHIHGGPCGEAAGVVVAMTDLGDMAGISTPLNVRAQDAPARGGAMVRSLSLPDLDEGAYSLRVHASSGESGPGPVVACADLSGGDGAGGTDATGGADGTEEGSAP